jgi:serine/threonine protein kinase
MFKLEAMSQLWHPCVISLISWDCFPTHSSSPNSDIRFISVTEYLPTDLDSVLRLSRKARCPSGFTGTTKSFIAFGVAFGMAYLHSKGIIHFDIKPSHILLNEDYFPRISGFDLSEVITLENATRITMNKGTPQYMAPETDNEEGAYGPEDICGAADVFSYGMMLWEMVAERRPFEQYTGAGAVIKVRQDIWEGKRPEIPEDVPPALGELIQACWNEDPYNRPLFEEIVGNPSVLLFAEAEETEYSDFCMKLIEQAVQSLD